MDKQNNHVHEPSITVIQNLINSVQTVIDMAKKFDVVGITIIDGQKRLRGARSSGIEKLVVFICEKPENARTLYLSEVSERSYKLLSSSWRTDKHF